MAATEVDTFSLPAEKLDMPFSILDTDLYKNAVLRHFPDAEVVIRFTNRAPEMRFTRECFDWIVERVNHLETLQLTTEERKRLAKACPYFPDSYLDFLSQLRLRPREQVKLTFTPKGDDGLGEIQCEIKGPWRECILYEIPVMATISEGYFKFVDTDWTPEGQFELAKKKALDLLNPPEGVTPIAFSEFGTRRRRSFAVHDEVMRGLIAGWEEHKAKGGKGVLSGTSNVFLALKYGLPPSGTIAHEWIMAIGATYGYAHANARAMDMWESVYPPTASHRPPLIMLTDTYTAGVFFADFVSDPERALRWNALRQDSGDPMVFVRQAKQAWEAVAASVGESKESALAGKRVVFSDSLDVERAIGLQRGCDGIGLAAAFGIGTFFTNDFKKRSDGTKQSKALNMVIKLSQIDGKDCVKLSDDPGKHTGNPAEVERAQRELGLI